MCAQALVPIIAVRLNVKRIISCRWCRLYVLMGYRRRGAADLQWREFTVRSPDKIWASDADDISASASAWWRHEPSLLTPAIIFTISGAGMSEISWSIATNKNNFPRSQQYSKQRKYLDDAAWNSRDMAFDIIFLTAVWAEAKSRQSFLTTLSRYDIAHVHFASMIATFLYMMISAAFYSL